MSDIQVTINSRSLERFFFITIILVLAGLNIYSWIGTDKLDTDNNATGNAIDTSAGAVARSAGIEGAETCSDGIKNQDETNVDCGGVCGGYWYEGKCNDIPQIQSNPEAECRLNSDCKAGFQCASGACVEIPPECETNSDCRYDEECKSGKCVEKRLSGKLDVKIETVEIGAGVGTETKKLKSVKLNIENGLSKTVVLYGKAYIYKSRSDPMYAVAQGGTFNIGSVKSAEAFSRFFTINGVSFPDDKSSRTVRIEIYDDDDVLIDSFEKNAYP